MSYELTDEQLRHAKSLVLVDPNVPGWGVTIPIPVPRERDLGRRPVFISVDATDSRAVQRWRKRVCAFLCESIR
jgi:hypothetical protein